MGLRKCCVGGCTATSETHQMFLIPKNDNLRALWLTFLAPTNAHLIGLTKSQLINRKVCAKHFDKTQFDEEGRRLRYSYPCLFSELEMALGEPRSKIEWNMLNEHNYFQKQGEVHILEPVLNIEKTADTFIPEPSCSFPMKDDKKQSSKDSTFHTQIKTVTALEVQGSDADAMLGQPSCSFTRNDEKNEGSQDSTFRTQIKAVTAVEDEGSALMKRKPVSKHRKFAKQILSISDRSLGDSAIHRLHQAEDILASPGIIEKFYAMPKYAQMFIKMQLKLVNKKKMARRFTFDEKLLALSLMKQSPKGYKLLEKMFTLPNKRTLSRVCENINFEPGINPHIYEHIKKTVNDWDEKKKICSILYDEVALTPHITFDESKDEIIGFVDVNEKKKLAYCDHALVFMVRGICASWRQCIAYYFVQGTVSASDLRVILKDIVVQVAETGLIPIALVSDQGSTFRTTIRNLRQDSVRSRNLEGIIDDGTIDIAGHQLNIFYDSPHLLKGLRNNVLNKDVMWEGKTGSWKDIIYIYDIDSKLGHTRALPKLTAYHVDPLKVRKMKVNIAAQVLSARTAAMLKYTDAICKSNQSTMKTTAEFVEFADNLFDSVNGYPGGARRGKLRSAVKQKSAHLNFWSMAIKKIKALKFIDRYSKVAIQSGQPRFVRVPSLEGWITSLESFIRISKILFEKFMIEYFYPRYINQDPLENFFGRLRALNYRNVNPSAISFIYSFKSLMLSTLLSPHSRFSNCEDDEGETLMDLNYLFNKKENKGNKENVSPNSDHALNITSSSQNRPGSLISQVVDEKIRVHCSAYTAGYMCRKLTKATNCKQCAKTYISQDVENIHMYIQFREYNTLKNNNLAYPNANFLRLYRDAAQIIHNYLNTYCYQKKLGSNIKKVLIQKLLLIADLGCSKHKQLVRKLFIKMVVRLQVHN